ncbi:sigma-70 family RNA polymerase sigma factor [Henriciella marina]|uniref:sigma-70 family RNA polymerase sigma factor n=1 Tax=Henriciella marina TaxID=453851 RepID=UPI0003A481F8|nr:sigma-70 family RNA polymerase sigma factor [Henriciella marina]
MIENTELSFVARLENLISELRAFAVSLCRDRSIADDLVQDTCLKAWASRHMFDETQSMRPWLFRILRNEFYMQKRRDWRSVNLEPDVIAAALVAEAQQETAKDFARMEGIISELPDGQRDALILILAAGMTYEEAGEVCGCSAGTIKSRVSRARDTVRQRFVSCESSSYLRAKPEPLGLPVLLNRLDELAVQGRHAA